MADRFRGGKRLWDAEDDARVRRLYPDTPTAALARKLRRSPLSVYQRAQMLGVKKSARFLATAASGRIRREDHRGRLAWFSKGHATWNKGCVRPGWHRGRMKETQFKKGELAGAAQAKWVPVGTVVADPDGYIKVKISDHRDRPSRFNWKFAHVLIWEEAHGPVKKGHAIVFKNGDKFDIRLGNLEQLTREQLMLRNSVHNLPKPLVRTIQLLGALRRQLRKREQHHGQDQHQRSA